LDGIDTATGSIVWGGYIHGTLDGTTLYAVDTVTPGSGDPSTQLSAIDAQTGETLWERTDGNGFSAPVVDAGVLYDTAGTTLEARDPGTGDLLWSRAWTSRTALTMAGAGDGLVFVTAWKGAVPGPHAMLAVVQSTHRVRWTHRNVRWVFTVQGGQVLAGDQPPAWYLAGQRLVSLDIGTGALIWSRTALLRAVSNGGVGFVDASYPREGTTALDLSDGAALRRWKHDDFATVAGGDLYTVNRNDRVRWYS
jgi:outer membrane protein assembly factor BamB